MGWDHEKRAFYTSGVLSFVWGFLIKYFIPTLLLLLLTDQMRKDSYAAGNYCGKNMQLKYQILGVLIFVTMISAVIVVAIFPDLMAQDFDKANAQAEEDKANAQAELGASGTNNSTDAAVELQETL